jgi:hypothetical protein
VTDLPVAIGPALVLSVVVGLFHTSLYVLIRGRLRAHLLVVLPVAIAGAWLGQAIGGRLGDPIRLGDFSILWASAMSWAGILLVAGVSALAGALSADR